jgi:hypothetical protein
MNNPVCAVCGHVSRVGAAACEMCDARPDTNGWACGDDQPGAPHEPYAPTGEPSWTAPDTSEPGGARPPAGDIPSPPFKGAGDVISPMLAVYRKHFTLVGLLVLVTTVPEALLHYGVMELAGTEAVAETGSGFGVFAVGAAGGLLYWLLSVVGAALLSGSLVYAVVDLQRTGAASARECLARGLKALPKVFIVTLLSGVIALVGYVMLIVPGVIVSLMLAVSVPVAVVEGLGPIDSLKRSKELTDGYKGLIFATYFLWGLLAAVLAWIVQWSFISAGMFEQLPSLILQTAVLGMVNSTVHVLTVYIYLGLLRERRSAFQTHTFTPGPEVAAR